MLRLLFVLMALSLATAVQADVSIHIEDFEDEQGNAGFDPMFNHSITLLDDKGLHWFANGAEYGRPNDWLLSLYYASDTVTFNLPPDQVVVAASIEVLSALDLSFGFVGETGEVVHDGFYNGVFEVSSQEIGNISSIWFQHRGVFNDITIEVIEVPEPSVAYCLTIIGFICGAVCFRRFNKA